MIQPVSANIFGMIDNPIGIVIVGALVLLLFGGNKMAGFGKSLGEGLKEFKKATKELHDEPAAEPPTAPQASAAPSVPTLTQVSPNGTPPVASGSPESEPANRA